MLFKRDVFGQRGIRSVMGVYNSPFDHWHITGQGPHKRCLAGAVGSQDGPVLTLVDLPAGVGQQKPLPDPQGDVFKSDDGLVFSHVQYRSLPEIVVFLDIEPVILIASFLK